MMAWIVVILGVVSAYFSIRHLIARSKAEEDGDLSRYPQGVKAWVLEVTWLIGSWLVVFAGVYMIVALKAGN